MPKLVFPLVPDGLLVDVLVGLDGDTTLAEIAAGKPLTAPIVTRGVIDTGCDMTGVSAAILQRLGVPLQYQTTVETTAGRMAVNVFQVSLSVRDLSNPTAPACVQDNVQLMELISALPNIEALVGLNFLLAINLLLEGHARCFTLEF